MKPDCPLRYEVVRAAGRNGLLDVLAQHQTAVAVLAGVAFSCLVVLAAVYHLDRDRETLAALAAEKYESTKLRSQLELMLANGDQGILLANLKTDMGDTELRLVPRSRGKK